MAETMMSVLIVVYTVDWYDHGKLANAQNVLKFAEHFIAN